MAAAAIAVSTLAERQSTLQPGMLPVLGEGVAPGDREGGALAMSADSSLAAWFLPYSSPVCCAVCRDVRKTEIMFVFGF